MSHNTLTISTPQDTVVGWRNTITGRVTPATSRVKVLVYSDDAKWYLQQDATVDGTGNWTANCVFGYPCSHAHDFTVVAIADLPIDDSPIESVPTTSHRSLPVNIKRLKI